MTYLDGLPVLLPLYDRPEARPSREERRVVKRRWGFDYRDLFRTRAAAVRAWRRGEL